MKNQEHTLEITHAKCESKTPCNLRHFKPQNDTDHLFCNSNPKNSHRLDNLLFD